MELFIFARFHAREGCEGDLAAAFPGTVLPTSEEPGCLSIAAFRSTRDPRLFFIHSRFVDEAAFELHATLPHTRHFLEAVVKLIDHPLDVTRATMLGDGTGGPSEEQ